MAMDPKVKKELLSKCEFILQCEITNLNLSPDSPGASTVEAKVLKVFQGAGGLKPEDPITYYRS